MNTYYPVSYTHLARILGQPEGIWSGHAGLFSNIEDMTKLSRGLIDGKILTDNDRNYIDVYKRQGPFSLKLILFTITSSFT